jgi:tetratricopeptide (TPR) repeat protein
MLATLLLAALFTNTSYSAQPGASNYDELVQRGKSELQAGHPDQSVTSGQAAIKLSKERWEGYALIGGALMNLKRFEEAADALSKAIERAPADKQPGLRDLRRQCLQTPSPALAETTKSPAAATTQAEIVLWKSIENSRNLGDFQAYVDQYPQGAFVALAKNHITAILHPLRRGEWCVPVTAAQGDILPRANDYTFAILSISGKSDKCSNADHPVLVTIEIRPGAKSTLSKARIRLPQGFIARQLDPAEVVDGVVIVANDNADDMTIIGKSFPRPSDTSLEQLVDSNLNYLRPDAILFKTSEIADLEISGMRAKRFTKEIRFKTSGAWSHHLLEVSTWIEADSEIFLLRTYSKNDRDRLTQVNRFANELVSFVRSPPVQ